MNPMFTVISPMYNVGRYLPEYFASLVAQTYGFDNLEVILVNDGSTDDTATIAELFAAKHQNVTVIHQENGGQANARNTGLSRATGQWVTFPDPDDVLSSNYFMAIHEALQVDPGAQFFSARTLMWHESVGRIVDNHALTGRFREGETSKRLLEHPSWIQGHVTSGFMRRDVIEKRNLRFEEALRLRFEDGAFVARYLLAFDDPSVHFVPTATYDYRQRTDNSSTVQSSSSDQRKYTDTIRHGLLPIVREAQTKLGVVPRWLQNVVLYDQFWILRSSQTAQVRNSRFPQTMYDELEDLIPKLLAYIDEDAISEFDIMYVAPWMRDALILRKRGVGVGPVYWSARDERLGLRSVLYRYYGPKPDVRVIIDGETVKPVFENVLGLEYAARPLVYEHTVWFPIADDTTVVVNDLEVEILDKPRAFVSAYPPLPRRSHRSQRRQRVRDAVARRLTPGGIAIVRRDLALRSRKMQQKFEHAWVFIDSDSDAGDSAEDQYWWMREHHPEVNSWFVVRKKSADWTRLEEKGARLVAYGSPEFYALLLHADHLASSQADRFITDARIGKMGAQRYAFTFLQHGVIKGDISNWLNAKNIQIFITSTQDETDYIINSTAYRHGQKEVRLAGLPRFDVLQQRALDVAESDRNLIVVMPTWRDYLVGNMGSHGRDRAGVDGFSETAYAKAWSALLSDEQFHALAKAHGKRIIFMPHPAMRTYLPSFDLPDNVEIRSYENTDVRELIIRSTMLITDYSSIAFNAAYIDAPVLYFQFDRDEYFSKHTERAGYFDYETHGFGPVALSIESAIHESMKILDGAFDQEFRDRVDITFPNRDGLNRQRVYEAMLSAWAPPTGTGIESESDAN